MSTKVWSERGIVSQYEPYTEEWYNAIEIDEDEMQTPLHILVIMYLISVLEQIYKERGQQVTVLNDVGFFQIIPWTSPDISVVNGMEPGMPVAPFIGQDAPPPLVVIEIASESTWEKDLVEKVELYERLGVPEYFAHDPHEPLLWKKEWVKENRLVGWRLDPANGRYARIPKVDGNKLWSEELQSWLVIEDTKLRLYTRDNQLRFTTTQTERQRAEVERQRAEAAEQEVARLKALLAQFDKPTGQ